MLGSAHLVSSSFWVKGAVARIVWMLGSSVWSFGCNVRFIAQSQCVLESKVWSVGSKVGAIGKQPPVLYPCNLPTIGVNRYGSESLWE